MEVARERHSHGFLRLTARPPLPNSLVRAVDKSVILEVQAILQVVQFVYEPENKVDDPDEEALKPLSGRCLLSRSPRTCL